MTSANSPPHKANASDEMSSHFPSDTNKRRSKSYLTGCCKRNTINKTSAIVTVVIFCLLFIAITLASIYPKRYKANLLRLREFISIALPHKVFDASFFYREVTAASPKENTTRTGKFVSSDFQKTVTSLLYPNTTDYDYLAVDQNQHNNKTLIGHDDDDYNE